LRLENAIQRVDLTFQRSFDEPDCDLVRGFVYVEWRLEGQLHQKLDFRKYPVDSHKLVMEFEDNLLSKTSLVYIKDDVITDDFPASGHSDTLLLPGWNVGEFNESEQDSKYSSGSFLKIYGASVFSNYKFSLEISRGPEVYLFKILPPIMITLAVSGLMFLLDMEAMDVRLATGVSGLLTLVFLQLSFAGNLPNAVDYLTVMDWIFNIGYLFTLIVIVECISVRKIYYRLLLSNQAVKDDITLNTITQQRSTTELNSSPEANNDILKEAQENKRRQMKIKRRIRRVEKYFFALYYICLAIIITFASVLGRFV
jgi:hypothetical protein